MNSRFGNTLYEWSHDTGDIHGADYGLSRDGLWSGASYAKSPVFLSSHDDMDSQLDRICSAQSVSKPNDPSVSLDPVKRDRTFTLGMPEKQRNLTKEELKREKRKQSNRESAKRSRARQKENSKKKELDMEGLKTDNEQLWNSVQLELGRNTELKEHLFQLKEALLNCQFAYGRTRN